MSNNYWWNEVRHYEGEYDRRYAEPRTQWMTMCIEYKLAEHEAEKRKEVRQVVARINAATKSAMRKVMASKATKKR